jgi:hypothetical protein
MALLYDFGVLSLPDRQLLWNHEFLKISQVGQFKPLLVNLVQVLQPFHIVQTPIVQTSNNKVLDNHMFSLTA